MAELDDFTSLLDKLSRGECSVTFAADENGQVRMGAGLWMSIDDCRDTMVKRWGAERVSEIENGRFFVQLPLGGDTAMR